MMTVKSRIIRCPKCGKSTRYDETNKERPFCSQRCKVADTAAWATEDYRVAGKKVDIDTINPDSDDDIY